MTAISSNTSTLPEAIMSNLRPLLERNLAFAATGAHAGLAIMPRQPVFLITCLDPRVDPAAFLGVELGDAPVIRNAGGRVTEAVINDIAFISYVARTMIPDGPLFEVAVVHHTGCGTGFLADAAFRSAFAARTGLDEARLAAEAVIDPAATVRIDVDRLLSSPKVPAQLGVSGHVYDLQTGLVTTIVEPAQPQAQGPSADAPDAVPAPSPADARPGMRITHRDGRRAGMTKQAWPTPRRPRGVKGNARPEPENLYAAGKLNRTEPPGIGDLERVW